jgi:hypothetical protein
MVGQCAERVYSILLNPLIENIAHSMVDFLAFNTQGYPKDIGSGSLLLRRVFFPATPNSPNKPLTLFIR